MDLQSLKAAVFFKAFWIFANYFWLSVIKKSEFKLLLKKDKRRECTRLQFFAIPDILFLW